MRAKKKTVTHFPLSKSFRRGLYKPLQLIHGVGLPNIMVTFRHKKCPTTMRAVRPAPSNKNLDIAMLQLFLIRRTFVVYFF